MKKQILFMALMVSIGVSVAAAALGAEKPAKVFILAGQSNMEGKANVSLLDYQIKAPETKELFKHLHKDGKYIVRDDVWIKFLERHGGLTVGFGSPGKCGVELEFGNVMGDHFAEPIVLIKAAWGGHSLFKLFRPPSAGMPSDEVLQQELEDAQTKIKNNNEKNNRNDPLPTMAEIKAVYGSSYRNIMSEVKETFENYETMFPALKGKKLELAGFVWFQGFNDMWGSAPGEYASNMAHFIRDVRKDMKVPNLPFVIGVMGQNGSQRAKGGMLEVQNAQLAMEKIAEFKGNVKAVRTDVLVDKNAERLIDSWQDHVEEWNKVGSDRPYHYLGSIIWFSRMGKAFGDAMLELMGGSPDGKDYHVSVNGNDTNNGSASQPLRTISAAAQLAQGGDVVIVHKGTYRERINPPRGGTSDSKRITYKAAEGEKVIIKGSEIVTGWKQTEKGVWMVTLPNTFFGDYNPYKDHIQGDWFDPRGRIHHTGEVYLNGRAISEDVSLDKVAQTAMRWYCENDDKNTTLWANFGDADPKGGLVEINARPACFYPDKPGRNYITVSGFIMQQAATQWAAPTAEQIALIGTHWSKGWIIENCMISDSKCVGITLGKDRASGHNNAESADGYNEVVRRALENGWSKQNIGSHIVRNNTIYNCGAAGICGSMGGAFSQITDNHIYNICMNKPFGGAEMAGIKLHAAIDTLIRNNRIRHCIRGIWLDWMAQGARVSANICYDNVQDDLFLEVNHGPYIVDNNLLLSQTAVLDCSQGGAFVHNLIVGNISVHPQGRHTPYHKPHSTEIAGLTNISGGDNRFYNNIFVGGTGTKIYDDAKLLPMQVEGNIYLNGSSPYPGEKNSIHQPQFDSDIKIIDKGDAVNLQVTLPKTTADQQNHLVTTELLGKAKIPALPFENPDGTTLQIDRDYLGNARNSQNPTAGPFENIGVGRLDLQVWQGQ